MFIACVMYLWGMLPIGRSALSSADREFLIRAIAATEAEMTIANMAPSNLATEETQALARRVTAYHARLSAALREFARFRKMRIRVPPFPKLDTLARSFKEERGRAFDKAFRQLLLTDPAGIIPLYHHGAAAVEDQILRQLAERTYGELKTQRPLAARAFLNRRIADRKKMTVPIAGSPKRRIKKAVTAEAKGGKVKKPDPQMTPQSRSTTSRFPSGKSKPASTK